MGRLLTCVFFLLQSSLFAQLSRIDSLRSSQGAQRDTTLIKTQLQIATLYRKVNLDSMYRFAERALSSSSKIGYKKGEAKAYLLMSSSTWRRGDLLKGLDLSETALKLAIEEKIKGLEAEALNNTGLIHNYQGDYPTALDFYQKALPIAEAIKDKKVIATILNNIGGLYYNLKDYNLALDYWKRTYQINQELNDKVSAGSTLGNLGMVYADKGDFRTSLKHHLQALSKYEATAACSRVYPLENIGNTYFKMGRMDSAQFFLHRALIEVANCHDPIVEIGILTGLANVYKGMNQHSKALPFLERAVKIGRKSGFSRETNIAVKSLSDLYEKLGRTKESFEAFKIYNSIQDSIYNSENAKAIGRLEAKYEYEAAKSKQIASQRIADLERERELTREKWLRNSFIAGFVVMIAVAGLVYRSFRRKKLSNLRLRLLNKEIKKQQKKLISQSKQLKKLNKSLNELNSDLELKIGDRTRELNTKNIELENQNLKLANYAFLNAHKLRAPVATLLGLIMLFENKGVENSERDEIVNKIKDCASDLDEIVREIRITLEMEKSQSES